MPPLAFIGSLLSVVCNNVTMSLMRLTWRECAQSMTWVSRARTCQETLNSELYPSIKTLYSGHEISQRKYQPGGDTFNTGWDFSRFQLLSDQLSSQIWNQSCFAVLFAALLGLYLFRERENSLLTSRDRSVTQMLLLIHLKFNQTIDSRQIKTFNTQIKLNKIAHFNKEQGFEFIWYRS